MVWYFLRKLIERESVILYLSDISEFFTCTSHCLLTQATCLHLEVEFVKGRFH